MSRLISLYPPAWRARYEEEFLDALSFRPMTWRDRIGLIAGAADARLHPELVGDGSPVPVGPPLPGGVEMFHRTVPVTLLLAVGATVAWLLTALLLARPSLDHDLVVTGETHQVMVLATVLLGATVWQVSPGSMLSRAGALILMASLATFYDGATTYPLIIGSVVVALDPLVDGTPRRLVGLALAALMVLSVWGYTAWFPVELDYRTYLIVSAIVYAGISLVISLPYMRRWHVMLAAACIASGAAITAGVAWKQDADLRLGFDLDCAMDHAACRTLAVKAEHAVLAQHPGAHVVSVEIDRLGVATACWWTQSPDEVNTCDVW